MVIYVKDLWVIESENLEIESTKAFVVYNPNTEKVLFESDDMTNCVKYAEGYEYKEHTDLETLRLIQYCFEEIEELMNTLQQDTHDKISELHTEGHTLQHCVRWGMTATEESQKMLMEEVQ